MSGVIVFNANLAQDVGKDKEGSYEASNAAEVCKQLYSWKSKTCFVLPV